MQILATKNCPNYLSPLLRKGFAFLFFTKLGMCDNLNLTYMIKNLKIFGCILREIQYDTKDPMIQMLTLFLLYSKAISM